MELTKSDEVYKEFMGKLDKEYGADIPGRLKKLLEEVGELVEACMIRHGAKENVFEKNEHVKEELGDVAFIVAHIAWLYGTDLETVIELAKDKFNYRMAEKNDFNDWFEELDFLTMEKMFRVKQIDFSPDDSGDAFIAYCKDEWDKLATVERADLFEEFA